MPTTEKARRRGATSRRVAWTDRAMQFVVTAGGLGTILAIASVGVFLVAVVVPLGSGADLERRAEQPLPVDGPAAAVALLLDEQGQVGIAVDAAGNALPFALADGRTGAGGRAFAPGARLVGRQGDRLLLARDDGSLQSVRVHLRSGIVGADAAPAAARAVAPDAVAVVDGCFWAAAGDEQYRRQELAIEPAEPLPFAARPLRLVDGTDTPNGPVFAGVDTDGVLHVQALTERENLLTGRVDRSWRGSHVPLATLVPDLAAAPDHVLLTGGGDNVLLLWDAGDLVRIDTRDLEAPRSAQRLRLFAEPAARVTAVALLLGDATLLVGDSLGRVRAWFRVRPEGASTPDGTELVAARTFAGADGSAVTALAPSPRTRVFAAGQASGAVRVFHGTSGRCIAEAGTGHGAVALLAMAPRQDGLAATAGGRITSWRLDVGHPEVTFASTLLPVWYEGYVRPEHVWQSTGGSDGFEPKFGLWPLVFGTLKATLYCLLFGVPIALLAAIYTSEFLRPRTRAAVKPVIELMASLPSVVLGFLAALVFAPLAETHLCSVLALAVCLPLAWLLGAQCWQALPDARRLALEHLRLPCCLVTLPLGVLLAWQLGPLAERWLFDGDLRTWLDGGRPGAADGGFAAAFPGWFAALLPVGALAGAWFAGRLPHTPRLDRRGLRFLAGTAACLLTAAALALLLAARGLDLRGVLVGTYVQRNSLVVGFVMGFAVIPIVYTIAEDAFAAVPEHLRAASLGAGATPWQTAVRIVLPTAMSGVFSAIMVGLGRAVGETMIVLMAAGNTPVLDLNLFNGFRTLSANIAVELPEAVRDSTHYRMLFATALCLFAMTFVLNTLAELVRQRFRRRAFQL